MNRRVVYVAHPLGLDRDERAANLARARRWFAWLLERRPADALVAPWMAYVEAPEETPENRARGIGDDLAVLRRCDAIVLVGGRLSPGMRAELDEARCRGLEVVDYLALGDEPPEAR